MQRNSKKRQTILNCLCSTGEHPTAEWIYEHLLPVYPGLSLATVYRNLGQLKKAGVIRSIGVIDGHERFDGKTEPHSHAVCSQCGAIIDIDDMQVPPDVIAAVERTTGYRISEASLQFKGLCKTCLLQQTK